MTVESDESELPDDVVRVELPHGLVAYYVLRCDPPDLPPSTAMEAPW